MQESQIQGNDTWISRNMPENALGVDRGMQRILKTKTMPEVALVILKADVWQSTLDPGACFQRSACA